MWKSYMEAPLTRLRMSDFKQIWVVKFDRKCSLKKEIPIYPIFSARNSTWKQYTNHVEFRSKFYLGSIPRVWFSISISLPRGWNPIKAIQTPRRFRGRAENRLVIFAVSAAHEFKRPTGDEQEHSRSTGWPNSTHHPAAFAGQILSGHPCSTIFCTI